MNNSPFSTLHAPLILMIEDDIGIMRNNRELLELEGYRVLEAYTLAEGKALVEKDNPDLILLDILLPDGNGLEYCRELRGDSAVSILFISALSTRDDVIEGILAGGDGYIVKPYPNKELLAYVDMLLRRSRMNRPDEQTLRLGALELKFAPRQAYLNGASLLLTPMEFTAIEYLAKHMGEYITAEELYEKVWGMDPANDVRTVWEHVSRIRNKFGKNAPVDIVTERGKGYRIEIKG